MFDLLRADYRAHGRRLGAQGFWAMAVYRFGRWRRGLHSRLARGLLRPVYDVLAKWIEIVAGIELPCEVEVGEGFVIDHFGGIVISGYAKFGKRCRIRNGCTVGLARVDDPCAPVIGDDVDIGAGAKLLGRIVVGDRVLIGANAVVVTDVPSDSVAVGVPARIRPRRDRPAAPAAATSPVVEPLAPSCR